MSAVWDRLGVAGVFLDPPYLYDAGRAANCYRLDDASVASAVREWALANGDNARMRIALCGYEGEHNMPDSWRCVPWKSAGGMDRLGEGDGEGNRARERIWFSPHCLGAKQADLFSNLGA